MKRGKAQYSLEFLVTYGWAFLIIGIVLGAIYTFGWVDASNFLPQRCTFYGQTACRDFYISNEEFNLSLVNNYGVALNVTAISLQVEGEDICTDIHQNVVWNRSEVGILHINFDSEPNCVDTLVTEFMTEDSRITATAIVQFHSPVTCADLDPECLHNSTGVIVGKVQ